MESLDFSAVFEVTLTSLWSGMDKYLSFNLEAFSILWSLGIGVACGALAFARFLNWLMRSYPRQSLVLLSGFMIGAIRSVWPFWSYAYAMMPLKLSKGPQLMMLDPLFPSLDSPLAWQALFCACGSFAFVFFLEAYMKKKQNESIC